MSTNYYLVNKKRKKIIDSFVQESDGILQQTQQMFTDFFNKNKEDYENLDVEYDIEQKINSFKYSVESMISDQEIKICTTTFEKVVFRTYQGSIGDALDSFRDLKTLKMFCEKYSDEWIIMDEYNKIFENFDEFYEHLEISDNYYMRWESQHW